MNRVVKLADNQDYEFKFDGIDLDEHPYDLDTGYWVLEIIGTAGIVKIDSDNQSTGTVPASMTVAKNLITVYVKGTKHKFGTGQLLARLTLEVPNPEFEDDVQIKKTLTAEIGVYIV